jgi:hypothetical protein
MGISQIAHVAGAVVKHVPDFGIASGIYLKYGNGRFKKHVDHYNAIAVVVHCITTAIIQEVDQANCNTADYFHPQSPHVILVARIITNIFQLPAFADKKNHDK